MFLFLALEATSLLTWITLASPVPVLVSLDHTGCITRTLMLTRSLLPPRYSCTSLTFCLRVLLHRQMVCVFDILSLKSCSLYDSQHWMNKFGSLETYDYYVTLAQYWGTLVLELSQDR